MYIQFIREQQMKQCVEGTVIMRATVHRQPPIDVNTGQKQSGREGKI